MEVYFEGEGAGQVSLALDLIRDGVRRGFIDPELGTLPKQAQLLCERLINVSDPKNKGQGMRRVRTDIRRIFHPIDKDEMRSPSIRRIVRTGDKLAWDAMALNLSKGPLALTRAVTPTATLHKANRNKRGRGLATDMVTLWKDRGALNRLTRDAQANIGIAKSGWLAGYLATGGRRAPDWVLRHGIRRGYYLPNFAVANPFIIVNNTTRWASYKGRARGIVRDAIAYRARDMEKFYRLAMKRANDEAEAQYRAKMGLAVPIKG